MIWCGYGVNDSISHILWFQFWHVLYEVVITSGMIGNDVSFHQSWADALKLIISLGLG